MKTITFAAALLAATALAGAAQAQNVAALVGDDSWPWSTSRQRRSRKP
jgi:hypothetical protein